MARKPRIEYEGAIHHVVKRAKGTENPPSVAATAAPQTDERGKLIIAVRQK